MCDMYNVDTHRDKGSIVCQRATWLRSRSLHTKNSDNPNKPTPREGGQPSNSFIMASRQLDTGFDSRVTAVQLLHGQAVTDSDILQCKDQEMNLKSDTAQFSAAQKRSS